MQRMARYPGESIRIGPDIELTLVDVYRWGRVQLTVSHNGVIGTRWLNPGHSVEITPQIVVESVKSRGQKLGKNQALLEIRAPAHVAIVRGEQRQAS